MPKNQIIPKGYESKLSLRETEKAIKDVKDFFQDNLSQSLNLQRVSAPRFVRTGTGVNDDLNGTERKVSFEIKYDPSIKAEVVFSLAKWKRMALKDYEFTPGEGLYTDMDAIRPDEDVLDNLHSIYVDQWDWEKILTREERDLDYLKSSVKKIYSVLKKTEDFIHSEYSDLVPVLPDEIYFIHSEDLAERYPSLTSKQREYEIAKEKGAVFIIGIGGVIKDGKIHDGRAPDYDDWSTPTSEKTKGLNGDIILWHPVLEREFEISSMGIRVDEDALRRQLKISDAEGRKEFEWHKRLLSGDLPLTIGGGIGQSRLCMFFLRKAHIGEVQASIWPKDVVEHCRSAGIMLL